ncbi:hypothetical protein GDO81_021669 [Engystomops pustulosus]|uniref:Uncharacterized protein n=1 Tax=Engystomops pustulosus TaxID=76066 RepID=A0AAV6YYA6_ENGPU|nr:hypothetical protein GDO81_021669 [Engystomops pustulosus]
MSLGGEAQWVMSEVDRYPEAFGSKINRDKRESLWLGEGGPDFGRVLGPWKCVREIKVLCIEFGKGGYALQNWDDGLNINAKKVDQWKGWSSTTLKES